MQSYISSKVSKLENSKLKFEYPSSMPSSGQLAPCSTDIDKQKLQNRVKESGQICDPLAAWQGVPPSTDFEMVKAHFLFIISITSGFLLTIQLIALQYLIRQVSVGAAI